MAILRLRLLLAVQHRESCAATAVGLEPTSPLWRSRVFGTRIDVSTEHADFPAVLAELLDGLHVLAYDMGEAAKHFAVTSSQLTSLLRSHPPALTWVNSNRIALGVNRLR